MLYKLIKVIIVFYFMKNHSYFIKIYQVIIIITLEDIDARIMVIDLNYGCNIAIGDVLYKYKAIL